MEVKEPALGVASLSTRGYDKGIKSTLYRNIPKLKEYVVVEPELISIEQYFINTSGNCELKGYKSISDSIHLDNIKVVFPVSDIYEGIAIN